MADVTQILQSIRNGNSQAAEELLPLIYTELRRLAAMKVAQERPGHTLSATSLVHEAYIRLVDKDDAQSWQNRGHFYAAAAEAMRRILIEAARRRRTLKRGGELERVDDALSQIMVFDHDSDNLIALDEALQDLKEQDETAAQLVSLRFFAGLTVDQAAESLGFSPRKADSLWRYARAWLRERLDN